MNNSRKLASSVGVMIAATTALIVAACSSIDSGPVSAAPTSPVSVASANAAANTTAHPHDNSELTPEQIAGIASVVEATGKYHAFAQSQKDGYTSQYPAGCAASPAGGQGFHYLNPALVDDKIELLKPELVMYEPQKNGSLKLVGVDYVVPFDKWTSPNAPTLLGRPFMRNEPLGVWALHIWAWRKNPSGVFAMWNPDVSCAFAN